MMTELEYIENYVMDIYGVDIETLYSKTKKDHICTVRYTFWYLLREACNWSLTRIAELVGKDHTTIIHGVKQFKIRGGEHQFNARTISRRMNNERVFFEDRYIGKPVDNPHISGD
jgi:chromosomal replication initiation ATPase DnaA